MTFDEALAEIEDAITSEYGDVYAEELEFLRSEFNRLRAPPAPNFVDHDY
jgi:hypothetical protein